MYGGSGCGSLGGIQAVKKPAHGRTHSLYLTLPPLSILFFKNF
jgi:1,4-alpha-glucan branching enzyme